jgi:hypothetical protein
MSKPRNFRRRGRGNKRNRKLQIAYTYAKRQMATTEYKHIQRQIAPVNNVDTDGHISSNLLNIAQGDADTERIGDKICIKRLDWQAEMRLGFETVDMNPDGTTAVNIQYNTGCLFRIILFWDHTNSIDTVAKVLGAAVTNPEWIVTNGYDVDYRPNYTIIHDKVYECNPNGTAVGDVYFHFHVKESYPKGKIVQYQGGTTTVNKNALKMLFVTNADTAESNDWKPDIVCNSRVYFTD